MDLHELSFAKIIILRDDIAEVIINDGVIMDLSMVREYHDFLVSKLSSPFSLLINKVNSYTYDFDAQLNLATLEEINVMAVVSCKRATTVTTKMLATVIPRDVEWKLKIFSDRDGAFSWLESEQNKSKLQ